MDLFDLVAKITLDTKDFEKNAKNAADEGQNLGSKIKSALGTAVKVGAAGIAAITTSATSLIGTMIKGASQTAEYGDQIDKMSQKLGMSAEAYQKWDYVLGQSGADINSMSTGLKTLTNKLDDAKNGGAEAQQMFAKLGLSMDDLATMSREDVFGAVINGFQGMADSTERAALANDIFGRSGQELTPLFNESAESTRELMQAAEDLGMVMSDEAVKASADYNDALDTLQRTFGGLKNQLMGNFMPSVTKVMEGLTGLFAGDSGTGLSLIKEGITDLVTNLTEQIPGFIEVGTEIVLALGDAIIENLPTLIDAGVQGLMAIVDGIIDHLPEIMTSGLRIVASLVSGLIKAIPQLVAAIPRLISAIVQGFLSYASELMGIGRNIVEGIKTGITNAWKGLVNSVTNLGKNLLSKIKGLFGIHSPSKVFAEIGGYMAEGLGVGWDKEFRSVQKDITDGLDFTAQTPQIGVTGGVSGAYMNGYGQRENGSGGVLDGLKIYLSNGALVGGLIKDVNYAMGNAYVQDIRGAMA